LKKIDKLTSLLTFVFIISGCTTNQPLNSTTFSDQEASEYVFETKALTISYLKRKLETFLVTSGPNLVKEINYDRTKGEAEVPFMAVMASDPTLYNNILLNPFVITEMARNIPFSNFLLQANPYPAVPFTSFDNVIADGFTAHWNTVTGATAYEILIDTEPPVNTGTNTSYQVTGLTGANHTFKVRAIKNTIMSNYSTPKDVVLPVAHIIYVNYAASGNNNGTSWAHAYTSLQDALDHSANGDSIWVAAGIYKPSKKSAVVEQSKTFKLISGVNIYGGFFGNEGSLGDRTAGNVTILSGDIDNNNVLDSNNAFHVVTGANNAIIDSFTITRGNAFGVSGVDTYGGGMLNDSNSPTINHITFTGNSGFLGGGMFNLNSSPAINDSTFTANTSPNAGGGMFNETSAPVLTNVSFISNTTAGDGGGMVNELDSPAILNNVTFTSNTAENTGGGMFNAQSTPVLNNVSFTSNSAVNFGGGISNILASPIITNANFASNSAPFGGGGGIYNFLSSNTELTNVTFYNNSASYGGAIGNEEAAPVIINATFFNNTDSFGGGGMYNGSNSDTTVKNSIFWGSIIYNESSILKLGFSDVENGFSAITNSGTLKNLAGIDITGDSSFSAAGNITGNPAFASTGASINLNILSNSAVRNTGTNTGAPLFDIIGTTRPKGGITDMGAYEFIE
jgi:hypothetical protein